MRRRAWLGLLGPVLVLPRVGPAMAEPAVLSSPHNLRMTWGPKSGPLGTLVTFSSVDPCPQPLPGQPDVVQVGLDLGDADGGDLASVKTDGRGYWTATIGFGADYEDRTAGRGERFHVYAECRWGPQEWDAGSYRGGYFTFRPPAHH